jgi:hypothetical protein
VYNILALRFKSVFKNFFLKFTYKYNTEIGEIMRREVRSGGSSVRRSSLTQGYSTNVRRSGIGMQGGMTV